jgi:uncharacterized protein YebE (UPF0316 family)
MEQLLTGPVGPLLIFLLRVVDVSLATLRLISAVRGRKLLAASVGFVEILIWIVVVGTMVRNLNSPTLVLAYAGGFAAGTWVGMTIEEKLALGLAEVQVVERWDPEAFVRVEEPRSIQRGWLLSRRRK